MFISSYENVDALECFTDVLLLKSESPRIHKGIYTIKNLPYGWFNKTAWRNGSAFDSRSKGCVFESRRGQIFGHGKSIPSKTNYGISFFFSFNTSWNTILKTLSVPNFHDRLIFSLTTVFLIDMFFFVFFFMSCLSTIVGYYLVLPSFCTWIFFQFS